MAPPRAAREFYRAQQRLTVLTVAATRRTWAGMGEEFDRSWGIVGPRLVVLASSAQLRAARNGAAYVPTALEQTGQPDNPVGEVATRTFAGVAADGRTLDGLLVGAVVETKTAVGQGLPVSESLARGGRWLDMAVQTLVADAARQSSGVAIAARPRVGWVRMVNPPTCAMCAILAGKFFRWNTGFQRHPRCFPAGVVVSGPGASAATRRAYQGELVVLTTSSGQELPVTGNHPVLTSRGWIPANLLNEGDEVVRSTRSEGATPLVVPNHHEVPARIEDVWGSLRVAGFHTVESSPEDFHGDGQHGEVYVVGAYRSLDDWVLAALDEHGAQRPLTVATRFGSSLHGERTAKTLDLRHAPEPGNLVGREGLGPALTFAEVLVANQSSLAHPATIHTCLGEDARDWPPRDAVLTGQPVLAGTGQVRIDDLIGGERKHAARWDAPGDTFAMETAAGYASVGRDLLQRLTGQVELDRLIEVRRVEWSGHVYSLTSVEGWHSANSLIVSNCDCTHIPSTEDRSGDFRTDPTALARSGQVTDLRPAEAAALRDGADLAQLVNARRGKAGLRGLTTTVGTTKRGLAGSRLRGQPRLTPEGIYAQSGGDRGEAIRLLRQHGYLI